MALSLQVCQLRAGNASYTKEGTGALEKVVKTLQTTWEVIASGISDPSGVNELIAGSASGLPSVNNSVYVDPISGQIYPYFFCTNKTIRRDTTNAYRFEVTCSYKDESGDETPQDPPADPENLCPVVSFSSGETAQTAWSGNVERNGAASAGAAAFLPTGDSYNSAILEKVGEMIVTHSQYENAFDEDDFRDRIMSVNSTTYRGYSAGGAMITGISWGAVNIPVSGGGYYTSIKVQYTIRCVEKTYNDLDDAGAPQTRTAGHHILMVRAGDTFLQIPNDLGSRVANSSKFPDSIGPCLLKSDGTRHDNANQGGNAAAAPIDQWMVQDSISFAFLRTCP